MSTDRRSGKDENFQIKYSKDYTHLENIKDEKLKKKDVVKVHLCSTYGLYSSYLKKMFGLFKEEEGESCSVASFSKYTLLHPKCI